ncbi:MAG: ABC transporter permease [Candidatus Tectimicrobiota bacterium]
MESRFNTQTLLTWVVILICAGLVLYPLVFLVQVALNTGDPQAWPPEQYGVDNFDGLFRSPKVLLNTLHVSALATSMAVLIGFTMAWILSRTDVPWRRSLESLMSLPYYVTPLVGALAWSALGSPRGGIINQLWYGLGGTQALVNINSPGGIAWVMALFEGSVAFVMISAAMKSMDPALEESSQTLGAGKLETMLRVTLPLVAPAVVGATIFVFAEMLGSFSAAAILGMPERFFVVTTAIWTLVIRFPPDFPVAAAMGLSLFGVMLTMMYLYRRVTRSATYVTITGKAFRPRLIQMGWWRWPLFGICLTYLSVAVFLPMLALIYVSLLKFATVIPKDISWTLDNYRQAFNLGPIRAALGTSLTLGLMTATVGMLLMGLLSWIIYRSQTRGRGVLEYIAMFPQSVPRLVFGLGLLLGWVVMPIPVYGTIWLLLLGYLTVFMPLGIRTISGVMVQLDKSVEECARVCGASWLYQLWTVTMPLLRPGLIAAWVLLFIASVREVGASVLLIGPQTKVIGPAIISSWESSGLQLTAAMALIQVSIVFAALLVLLIVAGRMARIEGE